MRKQFNRDGLAVSGWITIGRFLAEFDMWLLHWGLGATIRVERGSHGSISLDTRLGPLTLGVEWTFRHCLQCCELEE